MGRLGAVLVLGVLAGATAAHAKAVRVPRFPATVSDAVMRQLLEVGLVEASIPRDPASWLRWGGAPVEHQASAMRAVVDALRVAQPPIDLAAAILTIARVESGWNPYARNPGSTACGIFQFVRATWQSYDALQERCFDAKRNAAAGVKHLIGLYEAHVLPRLSEATPATSDADRVASTYRMLYALHFHGEVAPEALSGGSAASQAVADAGLGHLARYLTVLQKATIVRRPHRAHPRTRTTRKTSVRKTRGRG